MLLLVSSLALAYETDQLTQRSEPLEDILDLANDKMNAMLAEAVAKANKETRCEAPPATTRQVLARSIFQIVSRDTYVKGRKGLEGFGYGAYSAWLETGPVKRR